MGKNMKNNISHTHTRKSLSCTAEINQRCKSTMLPQKININGSWKKKENVKFSSSWICDMFLGDSQVMWVYLIFWTLYSLLLSYSNEKAGHCSAPPGWRALIYSHSIDGDIEVQRESKTKPSSLSLDLSTPWPELLHRLCPVPVGPLLRKPHSHHRHHRFIMTSFLMEGTKAPCSNKIRNRKTIFNSQK